MISSLMARKLACYCQHVNSDSYEGVIIYCQ